MADDSPLASLEARLARLRQKMEAAFPERARELRDAADALAVGEPDARDAVRRLAHKLRGTAGSHGHTQLSDKAAFLETRAADASTPTELLVASARALASQLDKACAAPAEDASAAPAPASAPLPSLAGRRFLAIDDDAHTRKLLEMTLVGLARAEARVVELPADLLAELDRDPRVDLVLVDAMMPDVSGIELAQALLARHPGVRVAFFSASTRAELGWDQDIAPGAPWLRKPFKPRDLVAALATLFEPAP